MVTKEYNNVFNHRRVNREYSKYTTMIIAHYEDKREEIQPYKHSKLLSSPMLILHL